MKSSAFLIVWIFLMLSQGCSQMPMAINFPLTTQQKVRSAHHWDVIADDVVSQTIQATNTNESLYGCSYYVQPCSGATTNFNKAFRNFLISNMVNRNLSVNSIKMSGSLDVQYETQVVRHKKGQRVYQPGTLTALTAGVLVARDLVLYGSDNAQIAGVMGAAILTDLAIGAIGGGPTDTEVIITTSIAQNNRFVMRKTDVYYLNDNDTNFNEPEPELVIYQEWKAVGK